MGVRRAARVALCGLALGPLCVDALKREGPAVAPEAVAPAAERASADTVSETATPTVRAAKTEAVDLPIPAAIELAAAAESGAISTEDVAKEEKLRARKRTAKAFGKTLVNHLVHHAKNKVMKFLGKERNTKDLSFVHVPLNFGSSITQTALLGGQPELPGMLAYSFSAETTEVQWKRARSLSAGRGAIWGHANPDLRAISNISGCNLWATPQKYWPQDVASAYFSNKRRVGLVRDPYDRIVAEFRQQASGGGRYPGDLKREEVSLREGAGEREGKAYLQYFDSCDVNAWVKEELGRYKAGDQFRGNCHLLPQAQFFEHPHGVNLPIDVRTLPDSFNVEMERHGYPFRMDRSPPKAASACKKVSAFSLDSEAKALVKELYAADFDILCRHFGYCDSDEMTCLSQFQFMCGGKGNPWAAQAQQTQLDQEAQTLQAGNGEMELPADPASPAHNVEPQQAGQVGQPTQSDKMAQ